MLNLEQAKYIEGYKELVVTWNLGNICPYKCSYCPDEYHNGSVPYHSKDIVLQTFNNLPGCTVAFMGGEPTYHPDFETIIQSKPKHIKIGVVSNGARPLSFWERIVNHLSYANLTFHSEHSILDRFIRVAELVYIRKQTIGKVFLVMNPEKWDYCLDTLTRLQDKKLPVQVKPILENFGFLSEKISSKYSQEQINYLASFIDAKTKKSIRIYNASNQLITETTPSEMLNNKLTNFSGWNCYAGIYHLSVELNGEIYDSRCRQRRSLGNIYRDFKLPSNPVLCQQNFCGCQADLQVKKERNK